jgi:hypothetical protein
MRTGRQATAAAAFLRMSASRAVRAAKSPPPIVYRLSFCEPGSAV